MHRNPSIAVVGGSLTGPALALLLRHAGFDRVTVYEAMDASVPLSGGVIGLDQVSLAALTLLGLQQAEYVPFTSNRIVRIKIADRMEAGRTSVVFPGRNTTWTLLHHALVTRLPEGSLYPGHRVNRVDNDESGRARLKFSNGGDVVADLVAFADGRASYGRRTLDPDRPLRYSGIVAHRGQAEYGVDGVRDFRRYEPVNGRQLNVFPVALNDGRIGLDWTFFTRVTTEQFHTMFGGAPTRRTFVHVDQVTELAYTAVDAEATRTLPREAAALIHRTRGRTAIPLLDIDAPRRMVNRIGDMPAVLIGDAVAPVYPHTARGANNGIVQAQSLTVALNHYRTYGSDIDTALAGWERRQLPAVLEALELGHARVRRAGLAA